MASKSVGHTVFALVLFAVGTLFGALYAAALPTSEREAAVRLADAALSAYAAADAAGGDGSVRAVLADAFFAHWKWIVVIALAGLSVVGLPVAWFLGFLKGAMVGFAIACLVSRGTADGWAAALAAVAPQQLMAAPAVVLMCAASSAFAASVVRERLNGRVSGRRLPVRQAARYAVAFVALTALVFVAAAVETFVSPVLVERAMSIAGGPGPTD